jgi:hypothetical protein
VKERVCKYCGLPFKRKIGKRNKGLYCSRLCAFRDPFGHYQRPSKAVQISLPLRKEPRLCLHKTFSTCIVCNAQIPIKGRRFCDDCGRRKRNDYQHNTGKQHGKTHVARAKRLGIPWELIRRQDIFARDEWTCQLCGDLTPRELMHDPRHPGAPTLDHIVPISKGGHHVRANVQCLCRRCNSLKGAKPMIVLPQIIAEGYWRVGAGGQV